MTAIPSQALPTFATDATVATGDEASLAPRVDPGSGILGQGAIGKRRFPARFLNWVIGGLADWTGYLREADAISLSNTAQVLELAVASASIINGGFVLQGNLYGSPVIEPAAEQQTVNTKLVWNLSALLPRNAFLTRISVDVQAETGYSVNPTGTEFPSLGLYSRSWSDNVIHHLTTDVFDAPADVAAYKTRHTLTIDFTAGLGVVDLRNIPLGGTYRSIYMVLTGAIGGSFAQGNVLFTNPRAYVTSNPWA